MARGHLIAALAALWLGAIAPGAVAGDSGLPLPRFVSLGAGEVNARAGPGFRYPVSWVFRRKHFPVEVIDEFANWRKVRDIDGAEGWVHRSMLSGRRSVIVTGARPEEEAGVRREPDDAAPLVARAQPGAQGHLLDCRGAWCRVEFAPYRGWLPRARLWGVYPGEVVK